MNRELAIEKAKILKALIELNKVSKILDSFIPTFRDKTIPKQDKVYLHGNFNLGGTVSGRLSSSKPNMQQIPSTGSKYAKPIKKCFSAPEGWLLCSADFNSLEDRISALTTKDINKLKVYVDGYDGHSLRAYYYFKDQMPDIKLASGEQKCYKAKVGNSYVHFTDTSEIVYQGTVYTGEELYELLSKKND
jgi:DNA polymerase-1